MSLNFEVRRLIVQELGESICEVPVQNLDAATQLMAKITSENSSAKGSLANWKITEDKDAMQLFPFPPSENPPNLSVTSEGITQLLRNDFPFSQVDEKWGLEAFAITEKNMFFSLSDVIGEIVKSHINELIPDSPAWHEMNTFLQCMKPSVFNDLIKEYYKDPSNYRSFHVLLKMVLAPSYSLPDTTDSKFIAVD